MEIQEEIVSLNTLNEVCIACLIKTDNMKQLLYADEEILQLITKLSSVSNLEIEVNDTLPCFLCNTCEEKLHISYDFQQLCRKSHQFILACLSATSSVIVKVDDIFKPVQLDDSSENTEIDSEQAKNSSGSSITYIDNDMLEEKVHISYEESETDVPAAESENFIMLKGTNVATTDSFEKVNNLNETCMDNYRIKIDNTNGTELLNTDGNFIRLAEVDEKIKCNETIRLPEYCSEEVDQIIIELDDEDTPTIDIQPEQLECESNSPIAFINNNAAENLDEKCKSGNSSINEFLNNEGNFVKPKEVDKRTKSNQTMRLSQYTPEEVDKIITEIKLRYSRNVNCIYCRFTAKDSRALSLHMTRLHKELKERWCLWCNESFENMDEHMNDHKDNFKCPFCEKYRTSTGHFFEHLASHSPERKYVCELCGKKFISARHLRIHGKVHTEEKPLVCRVCWKRFTSPKSLNSHLKIHKDRWCAICEEYLDSDTENAIHKCFHKGDKDNGEDKDSAKPQNYCKECNKKVRSLQRHTELHHSNKDKDRKDRKCLCTYCGKQFSSTAKLTVHTRTHTGEAPYQCSFCEKRMTTRVHLVVHQRTHTGEKPHTCKICGRSFAQSSVLNTHMRLHTGRPEQCAICLKRFCRPSELRQHMRCHTGEKPFECATCGQAFKQKSHLVEHSKIHSDVRPYKCDYCDKSFKQSGTLKSHRNIHLGNKPYKCSQCSYACRQSHCLSQHMQQHENDQPKADKPHRCDVCERSFTTVAMFTSHFNSQHRTLDSS